MSLNKIGTNCFSLCNTKFVLANSLSGLLNYFTFYTATCIEHMKSGFQKMGEIGWKIWNSIFTVLLLLPLNPIEKLYKEEGKHITQKHDKKNNNSREVREIIKYFSIFTKEKKIRGPLIKFSEKDSL